MKQEKPGNVLMVANYPSDTGYAWWLMEHFWKILAERADGAGCAAYLAYPRISTLSDCIEKAPITPVELSIPWNSMQQAASVARFLKEKKIKYVYLTDQKYFHLQYPVMRSCGVEHIVVHDHSPGDRPRVIGVKGFVKALRNSLPFFSADHVFCVSDFIRRRNMENARIPARKCVVVQNGITSVTSDPGLRRRLRGEMGFDETTLLVIATGRAHPYKRFDFIIDCAGLVTSRAPELDIRFLIAGDGPAMPDLRERVGRLGLGETVQLLGFRSDVRELLGVCDVAMHAALGEAFSLSIIEYMSAGLPVLVPDIPSVKQAVRDGETGFVYAADDREGAAARLIELARGREKRLAMGRAARRDADTCYNIERCTSDFHRALDLSGFPRQPRRAEKSE